MPTPAEMTTWPFLSVVAWPEGWLRAGVAELLAGFGAMDMPTLNMRLGRKPPMVLERVEPSVAHAMIAALVDRGGDGFTFTIDDLARLGPAMRIAELVVGEGILTLQLHGGLQTSVRSTTVDVIVRGRTVNTIKTPTQVDLTSMMRPSHRSWDSIKAEV